MIRLRSRTRTCDSGPAMSVLLPQLHVDADHVAAIEAFANEDQTTCTIDHRALDDGDWCVQRHIESGRRLDICGPDDKRLPRILDLEAGNVRDELQRGLAFEIAF